MVKLAVARPLRTTETFTATCLLPLPGDINYEKLYLSIFITAFKNSLQWFPVWTAAFSQGLGGTCHRNLQCPSLSIMGLQSTRTLSKKLPCSQQPAATQIIDFHMVSGVTTAHGPQHVPQRQHPPRTTIWRPSRAQITDTNIASGGNTDHGHQLGLQ